MRNRLFRRTQKQRFNLIYIIMTIIRKKKIVVIGSCNTDMVIKTSRLPIPGETILGGEFMMNPGGKGANQAVAVSRLGGDVTFLCKTGNDMFGAQSVELYKSEGIDATYIFRDSESPSGVALITVDMNGENSIVVASGANNHLSSDDVIKAKDVIESADILQMQLEIPMQTVEYAARIAHAKGVKVILNPAPAPASPLSDELLKNVDIIIPNVTETGIISGKAVTDYQSAVIAADIIASKGVETIIITMGSKGAFIKDGDAYYEVPANKVQAVDTTAAGDTFCGALCVGLSENMELKSAVEFAGKASAISVTRMGAQASVPYRDEIK